MGVSGQKIAGAQGAIAGNQAAMGQVMGAVGQIGSSAIGADWRPTEEKIANLFKKQ